MYNSKPVQILLARNFKLSTEQCLQTEAEQQEMAKVPYSNAVRSLMHAMVLIRPYISHNMSVVSRFITNLGINLWRIVK